MTHYWYQMPACARLEVPELLELLKPMGGEMKAAAGSSVYYRDQESGRILQNIGSLTVYPDGRICAWPHVDLTDRTLRYLLASVENAFRNCPSRATGWRFRQRPNKKSLLGRRDQLPGARRRSGRDGNALGLADRAGGVAPARPRRQAGAVPVTARAARLHHADVDEIAVERAVSGDPPGRMTCDELDAAVAILHRRGMSAVEIGQRIRVTGRTVVRARRRNRARELVSA